MDNSLDPSCKDVSPEEFLRTHFSVLRTSHWACHKRVWISAESALWNGCRGKGPVQHSKQQMLSKPRLCLALSQIVSIPSSVFMPESLPGSHIFTSMLCWSSEHFHTRYNCMSTNTHIPTSNIHYQTSRIKGKINALLTFSFVGKFTS